MTGLLEHFAVLEGPLVHRSMAVVPVLDEVLE